MFSVGKRVFDRNFWSFSVFDRNGKRGLPLIPFPPQALIIKKIESIAIFFHFLSIFDCKGSQYAANKANITNISDQKKRKNNNKKKGMTSLLFSLYFLQKFCPDYKTRGK